MNLVTKQVIKTALSHARYHYSKGNRYYDDKHKTYNPASYCENILQHVCDLIGYYGLESYSLGDINPSYPEYNYINSGDTYRLTLVYNHNSGRFMITDIGSVIESRESEIEVNCE